MTFDEKKLLGGVVLAVDEILRGLARGAGTDFWQGFLDEWIRDSQETRARLSDMWEREPGADDERGEHE